VGDANPFGQGQGTTPRIQELPKPRNADFVDTYGQTIHNRPERVLADLRGLTTGADLLQKVVANPGGAIVGLRGLLRLWRRLDET
jgi:hypothetical protein